MSPTPEHSTQINRHMRPRLEEALNAFRVVLLHGARQSGKTTLARLVAAEQGGDYASLDDEATLQAALADPLTFLSELRPPATVDEIQLGGDRLVRTVKRLVDEDPTPGRFLLTGSTNFLTVPNISESLAGRVRILNLGPLSEAELAGTPSSVVDGWFERPFGAAPPAAPARGDYLERVCRGGYPEVLTLEPSLRPGWFESYVETVTGRDTAALADIRKAAALPRLLRWAAASTGAEFNASNAASALEIDRRTIVSYLEWLQTVFLVRQLPAWSRNLAARVVRRPKLHLADTGLAADVLGFDAAALAPATAPATGALLESFVVNEIARQAAVAPRSDRLSLHHYRDHSGHEVDLVIERRDGAVAAVEVKATSSPTSAQLKSTAWLRDKLDAVDPGAFRAGFLLHTGDHALTVGDRLHLRPIASLWTAPAPGLAPSLG